MSAPDSALLFTRDRELCIEISDTSFSPPHKHNFLEIAYVAEGSAVHFFNGRSLIVRKGDYFAVDFDEIHGYTPNGSDAFTVVNLIFHPEFVDVSLKDCKGFSDLVASYSINYHYFTLGDIPTKLIYHDDDGEVKELFDKCLREYRGRNPKYRELIRCYLTELIILTLRKVHSTDADRVYSSEIVKKILSIVNRDYAQDLKLSDICAEIGYSLSYTSSLFSRMVGLSFSRYLQNIRIENACHLLSNTDKSIEEVAEEVGYRDIKFFRSLFKKKLKLSPAQFRNMAKRNR